MEFNYLGAKLTFSTNSQIPNVGQLKQVLQMLMAHVNTVNE